MYGVFNTEGHRDRGNNNNRGSAVCLAIRGSLSRSTFGCETVALSSGTPPRNPSGNTRADAE